jgi:4-amino-4-deoxy-L-arabinose transferase-like glycosyltransferase
VGLAFALFVGAGSGAAGLSGDTAVYATVGREMVERGDWTRLTVDGEPYRNKPPLVFWCEAAAMSLLGFTEAAARLPSRLFGLATVVLLLALVARTHGRRTAFWAGTALVTWLVFQRSASLPRLDTALAFWSLASVGAFLRIDRRGPTAPRAAGLGACCALAVLSKGPAGLLAPGAIAIAAVATGRGRLLLRTAAVAAPVTLLLAAPWYALQMAREGTEYAVRLGRDLERGGSPFSDVPAAVRLYATDVFLLGLPWLAPLALGVRMAVLRARRDARRALAEAILVVFALLHLAGVASRNAHYSRYFVVAIPAYAWLAGIATAAALRRTRSLSVRRLHVPVAAGLAFAVLVGYPLALATGITAQGDRYADLRRAVAVLSEEAPGSRTLPTWSEKQEPVPGAARDPSGDIGLATRAASRFYFGVSLVPWREGDPAQPPLVYLRHGSGAEPFRSRFEARRLLEPVLRGQDGSLYRTR